MSDVRPPNDHGSYPGDQPWHVPFPSPPPTPNHDPTSSGSEAESNDPLDKISAVKHDLQYFKELESLKLKLEERKKNSIENFTKSEEYNHEMVECFNNGFEMF
ncbi:unnamed protein product [Prunus brigantina]